MGHCTINLNVNKADFDASNKLKADRIFSFFQDASEADAVALGFGPDDLFKNGHIWVLTKVHIIYRKDIEQGRELICSTYPAAQKRATYKRDYYINYKDEGPSPEKALIVASGQWCILNYKTRKLERNVLKFDIPDGEIQMIDEIFPKLHAKNLDFIGEYVVSENDIDRNNHCNNARYISIAEEVSKKNISSELRVNFVSETMLNDSFDLFVEEQEAGTYVEGCKKDGTKVFQIILK